MYVLRGTGFVFAIGWLGCKLVDVPYLYPKVGLCGKNPRNPRLSVCFSDILTLGLVISYLSPEQRCHGGHLASKMPYLGYLS